MSGGKISIVAVGLSKRPGSVRRATEKDPLQRHDSPATSSSEVDMSTLINAFKTIQKVDLSALRRQLNSTVPHDLKNGQDVSARWAENVDWKMKYMDLKGEYDKLSKQKEEKQKLEDKLINLQAQFKTTEQISSDQNNELVLLRQRVESGNKDLKDLQQKLQVCINDLESKEKKLKNQQQAMEEVQKAKDDALTRLSRLMGRQMSEGNPNITDLSDQNRPSKLGEMYSELYDNEWTNAFEVLTETVRLDDESSINLLLKILWESSKHASDMSQSAMKRIENLLVTPDCKRLLREARKHVDIKKADSLFQDFRDKLTTLVDREYVREEKDFQGKLTTMVRWNYLRKEKVEDYIKKCFQLCWLMSIQDPPVVLSRDPERGAQFDTNLYKHYMHSGDNIDYVIWPALLLYTDGPLLAKGVAEPCTIPKAKSAPATAKDNKSFVKRSQIEHDGKVRESTYGSDRMDTTQYGNDAPFSSALGYSPKVTQKYPAHESKYGVHSETPSTRGQSQVSKNDMSFDKRNQIAHDGKVRESTSESDRMDTTQYRNDASYSSKSRYSPIVTQKYPVHESKYRVHSATPTSPGQSQVSEQMQLYQPDIFTSKYDRDRFQKFCQDLQRFRESLLRCIYGTDYDRYYMIYSNPK